jgi:hypothetical protein
MATDMSGQTSTKSGPENLPPPNISLEFAIFPEIHSLTEDSESPVLTITITSHATQPITIYTWATYFIHNVLWPIPSPARNRCSKLILVITPPGDLIGQPSLRFSLGDTSKVQPAFTRLNSYTNLATCTPKMVDEQELPGASNSVADAPSLQAPRASNRPPKPSARLIASQGQEQTPEPIQLTRRKRKQQFTLHEDLNTPPPS